MCTMQAQVQSAVIRNLLSVQTIENQFCKSIKLFDYCISYNVAYYHIYMIRYNVRKWRFSCIKYNILNPFMNKIVLLFLKTKSYYSDHGCHENTLKISFFSITLQQYLS